MATTTAIMMEISNTNTNTNTDTIGNIVSDELRFFYSKIYER